MPVVGGFKHALVSDGTGLNVDNSPPADVRYWQILLKNYSGKEALALWRSMCRFGLAAFGA
jgi:hypothetical protein